MRLAIIGRYEEYVNEKPFSKRFYLDYDYKRIFDDLDILLIPVVSGENLEQIVNYCDGLVVTGSTNNVNPRYYGEKPVDGINYNYDDFPLVRDIVNKFAAVNKPIIGICAGIQEINVIFGGTLYQDIKGHYLKDESKHSVKIIEGTVLFDIYDKKEIEVNSFHRQAIKEIAKDFKISAVSNDGIIEGIEKDNIIAVQWHPEVMNNDMVFKKIINKLFNNRDLIDKILKDVAPCSMFCSTCTGCKYGEISNHAKELLRLLDGHKEFLDKNLKSAYRHKLEEFLVFENKLKKYAYPKCNGCRTGGANGCSIKGCFINDCVKEHGVNYCGECDLFPCDKVNKNIFKDRVINKWLEGNKRIKEVGIIKYYEEKKGNSHYVDYKSE